MVMMMMMFSKKIQCHSVHAFPVTAVTELAGSRSVMPLGPLSPLLPFISNIITAEKQKNAASPTLVVESRTAEVKKLLYHRQIPSLALVFRFRSNGQLHCRNTANLLGADEPLQPPRYVTAIVGRLQIEAAAYNSIYNIY